MSERTEDQLDQDDLRLKIQALADSELPPQEIHAILTVIQGNYELRTEYAELLRLNARIHQAREPGSPEPSPPRRYGLAFGAGLAVFGGSYAVLLGYALYSLIVRGTPLAIIASVSGIIGGILLLLAGAIRDRRRERKTDRYDEVIR